MRMASVAGTVCLAVVLAVVPAGAQLRTQVVVQGVSGAVAFVQDPTSVTRFFIVQQGGLIRVLENGQLLPTPLLNLQSVIASGGERGLLGMAFPPDAVSTGRFFLNFSDTNGNTVIARFQRTPANAVTVNPSTRFDLRWPGGQRVITQPYANHNGGHLAFGPDGYLYVGLGDGGSGNDPQNHAQNPQSLLGKMLRIDVNVPDSHPDGYVVPSDNPFLDAQPIQALGEIWAFGLRNPWRYSFDDLGAGATGALVIADVGQGAREEVNYEPARAGGRNYGWSVREGQIPTPGVGNRVPAYQPLTNPLFDYGRSIGQSVTGGYVYRGTRLPPVYRGRYFVGDAMSSIVGSVGVAVNPSTGEATFLDAVDHTAELGGSLGGIASFGRDHEGELYLVTLNGRVLKIVPADTPGAPSGLTATVSGRTVTLSWAAPASGATPTGYLLEAGSSPGAANLASFATGLVPSIAVGGVADGIYFVRVRAVRNGVVGPPTADVQVVVAGCPVPAAPSGLARTGTGTTVVLSWTAAPGASSHVVEAGASSGQAGLAMLPVAGTSLTASAPPGQYFVRVRGVNACGTGPSSTEVVVQVP